MKRYKLTYKNKAALLPLLLLAAAMAMFLTACAAPGGGGKKGGEDPGPGAAQDRLNVVATLFPYYDFARQIGGEHINLTLIIPAGMDSHSFEPTPADMITIQNADLLICNGGAMEQWLAKVLDSFGGGPAPERIVTMMDYVDTVEEEIVEGMEAEDHDHEGHDHEVHDHEAHTSDRENSSDDGHEVEIEYDEHIWTSPVNAMKLAGVLAVALEEEDPANAELYRENNKRYQEKLRDLDQEFREIVENGKRDLLVFGDKFPLRYFFDEYGLNYRAAFTGCSTDTEPSAQTIAYLIDKVEEDGIPVVYYLELSSHRVAEIIGEETGAEPLLFHSCHNVTRRQFDGGVTYLELMEQNAENLRKGLN